MGRLTNIMPVTIRIFCSMIIFPILLVYSSTLVYALGKLEFTCWRRAVTLNINVQLNLERSRSLSEYTCTLKPRLFNVISRYFTCKYRLTSLSDTCATLILGRHHRLQPGQLNS